MPDATVADSIDCWLIGRNSERGHWTAFVMSEHGLRLRPPGFAYFSVTGIQRGTYPQIVCPSGRAGSRVLEASS